MKKIKSGTLLLALFTCSLAMHAQDDNNVNFDTFDTNKNGSISFYEWKTKKRKNERTDQQLITSFSQLDTNRSRSLTEDEFIAYSSSENVQDNRQGNTSKKMDRPNTGGNRSLQNKESLKYEKLMGKFDSDENGTINFDEWKNKKRKKVNSIEKLKKSFDRVDSNNSGDITLKELKDNFLFKK